jgi:hypothetical protein
MCDRIASKEKVIICVKNVESKEREQKHKDYVLQPEGLYIYGGKPLIATCLL